MRGRCYARLLRVGGAGTIAFLTLLTMSTLDADPPRSPPAEGELVRRFWDRVRLFALRRTGDAAAAEDVAQETLRRVIDALRSDRVLNVAALPGFVFQTARHVCLHYGRSAQREGRAMERLSRAGDGPERADALTSLVTAERCASVRRALVRLPDPDRALLAALYYEQLDPGEAAARLGLTGGALRVRKHRALKRLGELLGRNESGGSGT
jgi:RNA polymerase sigma-70 factor, ECF subfamily